LASPAKQHSALFLVLRSLRLASPAKQHSALFFVLRSLRLASPANSIISKLFSFMQPAVDEQPLALPLALSDLPFAKILNYLPVKDHHRQANLSREYKRLTEAAEREKVEFTKEEWDVGVEACDSQ
jgi:hypothetical protein